MRRGWLAALLALGLGGCSLFAPSDHFGSREMAYNQLIGWEQDDHALAAAVFADSCEVFARKARAESDGSGLRVRESVWNSLCGDARAASEDPAKAKAFFESRFVPFRVNNNGKEQGLFTGYYEPVLYGSRRKHGDFKYPLHAAPSDLAGNKPYLTHAEINGGALDGRGLEILWVDDPVMKFFMQIQGSGRVRLDTGGQVSIGYADGNGQAYMSLGKIMGDENILPKDQINFFTIRQWLYEHPKEAFAMMERNPSYIFFKERDKLGAVGAAAVVLTPQRSIAVDSRYIPYGLPLFIETALPSEGGQPEAPFRKLVVAQDTGGAIKGPVRADIFFGFGDEAEYLAGYMKGRGVYTLLVPREIADQLRPTELLPTLPTKLWPSVF